MQEKEFRILMEKSIKGALTKEEQLTLERFQQRLAANTKEVCFENELYKTQIKETMWTGINKQIKTSARIRVRNIGGSVAAVFIGLWVIGYIFLQVDESLVNSTPLNAITLELEDGTIKVLEETKDIAVVNKRGQVIGKGTNKQLIYEKTKNISKELIYNIITVPYGKTFELQLSDGTKAHLNAGSSIKFPTQFIKGIDRQVYVYGEAFLEVSKDSLHPFIVHTHNLNVQVFGTKFNVHAYPEDDISEIVLIEGSVGLYPQVDVDSSGTITMLEPGYKANFDRKYKEITKEAVITEVYTSWMKGESVFRNMLFDNMLKKLERHYNVTIINNNKELSRQRFNASFGTVTIDRIFENLSTYHGIQYEINGSTITIK
ncbi:FecR family protein [Arenibacter sp. ARW7G5Y1]|uniref:FecR family protein n=1 Tax=Arenibacter sp. ARW7G5Y1 TaxID=2135619 RepID=UPI000D7587D2|nr:FecR domain-containing protein [Arenibacter sp. ARW7G5Y1]PXX21840.1 FecR family protein [Arenibacter sp. ARW7G5Y1]